MFLNHLIKVSPSSYKSNTIIKEVSNKTFPSIIRLMSDLLRTERNSSPTAFNSHFKTHALLHTHCLLPTKQHSIAVDGRVSSFAFFLSGVPQGTVLQSFIFWGPQGGHTICFDPTNY